ncbi:MAG TPA: SDR family oxidoreductase [Dehalococcoidia bacterium]|nr:SDR family oxidoreductase [Dehalococcoidia bacterium]
MPDMTGKTCLVTGANQGIGKETALALARLGATVVMTSRDLAKGEAALADVRSRSGGDVELMIADFGSFASIRKLAADFKAKHPRLDVLVNNAGAILLRRSETEDGFETTFGVNHLGYFLLTNLLLDVLKASAPARIVNVSSRAHLGVKMDFDNLNSTRGRYSAMGVYSRSKLGNVLFTYELARRLAGTGVTANCVHPGVVRSGFGKNNPGLGRLVFQTFQVVARPFILSPEKGAATSIYVASCPELEGVTGKYFVDCREKPSSPASYDEEAQRRLWEISEQMCGVGAGVADA